tara:strand:+ start:4253 stop:6031 length:1779 start_codon:yes stop_codon:yes gene_type:complete
MYFQLPSQIKREVVNYDNTLKALARQEEQNANPKRKKSKYPRGNVISLGLIPEDIIKLTDQQAAIDRINANSTRDTFHLFKRLKELGESEPCAILYYYKQMWISFWVPKDSKDYWYGMSVAYKNNKTARKVINTNNIWFNTKKPHDPLYDVEKFNQTKIGRTEWLHKTVFFTQDVINDGHTGYYWRGSCDTHCINTYGRNYNMANAISKVSDVLRERVPQWSDDRNYSGAGIWVRTTPGGNSIAHCLYSQRSSNVRPYVNPAVYRNTSDYWIKVFQDSVLVKDQPGMKALVKTPWFRKKLNWMCNAMQLAFDKAGDHASVFDVSAPFGEVSSFLQTCREITNLYPDINVDFLISRYDLLVETSFNTRRREVHGAIAWIQEHLSVESFLNMLSKFHAVSVEDSNKNRGGYRYTFDEHMKRICYYWRDFEDTIRMVDQIVEYNNRLSEDETKLDPMPRRWRIDEWHDHVMGETWKITNPKIDLPQKLFPQPIKVNNFTFIQPIDTHQLSKWGKAVRNCVGSSSYAEGIKKFKHLIVLAMIEGRPRYTIQLNVDNGIMKVVQMTDVHNKRLTQDQREVLQSVFSTALQEREKQLA